MANEVRSVSVVFKAFTDKFEQKTAKAGKSVSNFAGGAVKSLAIAGAGFLAAKATFGNFIDEFQKLDQIGKLSDSLNVDPNFLRGLDLAATQTGLSFEEIVKAVEKANVKIGEARLGFGSGAKALKDLGLTAEEFGGLSTEEIFTKIINKISELPDAAQKAAAAQALLGKGGKDLIPLMNAGAGAIENFIKQAEELGGPISREDIARVEAANDAIDKMGRAWDGIVQQLAIELAPVVEDLASAFVIMGKSVRGIGDAWVNVQKGVEDTFLLIADKLGLLDTDLSSALNIELGEVKAPKDKDLGAGDDEVAAIKEVKSVQSFAEAAAGSTSAAFDILNPDRPGSVQNEQLTQQKKIATEVQKTNEILEDGGAKFVKVEV